MFSGASYADDVFEARGMGILYYPVKQIKKQLSKN